LGSSADSCTVAVRTAQLDTVPALCILELARPAALSARFRRFGLSQGLVIGAAEPVEVARVATTVWVVFGCCQAPGLLDLIR